VTKSELGTKRRCTSCDTKFFDLNKDPVVCPKCMAVFVPPQPDPAPSRRAPSRQPWTAQRVTNVSNEFVSLEGTNADTEIKSPSAEAEEADGDILLLDDQDGKLEAAP